MLDVVEVVAGDHLDDVFYAFFAAFGVGAGVLPLRRRERFVEREVGLTEDAHLLEAEARIAFFVMAGSDPGVLIVGLHGGSGRAEDGADAPADDDFDIGEMGGKDFGDGPFAGRGLFAELAGLRFLMRRASVLGVADWSFRGSLPAEWARMRWVYC